MQIGLFVLGGVLVVLGTAVPIARILIAHRPGKQLIDSRRYVGFGLLAQFVGVALFVLASLV